MITFRNMFFTVVCALFILTSASAAEMPVDTSFGDQGQLSDSYADRELVKGTSLGGLASRSIVKMLASTILSKYITKNLNFQYVIKALIEEGLIEIDVCADTNIIHKHKNATWEQWFFSLDDKQGVDLSEHTSLSKKIWDALFLSIWSSGISKKPFDLTGKTAEEIMANAFEPNIKGTVGCFASYMIAEALRQQMIDKNDSPRLANIVAILAAGGMNELVKKAV